MDVDVENNGDGETAPAALARTYVADWRATDHAWVCSTVALFQLPGELAATAGDDAAEAGWFPLASLTD